MMISLRVCAALQAVGAEGSTARKGFYALESSKRCRSLHGTLVEMALMGSGVAAWSLEAVRCGLYLSLGKLLRFFSNRCFNAS